MQKKFTIVSFNTLGAPIAPWAVKKGWNVRRRYHAITKELNNCNADILALQEVYTYGHIRFLKGLLKEYPYKYYKKSLMGPKGGLVVFSKYVMKPIEFLGFTTRGKYLSPSIIGKFMRNGVLICKIENTPIYLINTHLTPNLDMDWQASNRFVPILQAQLDQIAILVAKLSSEESEVIITGDFNTSKQSPLYTSFLLDSTLQDIFFDNDKPTVLQPFLRKNHKSATIDYIFIRNTLFSTKIHSKKHLFTQQTKNKKGKIVYLSDHIGLHAEIEFKKL